MKTIFFSLLTSLLVHAFILFIGFFPVQEKQRKPIPSPRGSGNDILKVKTIPKKRTKSKAPIMPQVPVQSSQAPPPQPPPSQPLDKLNLDSLRISPEPVKSQQGNRITVNRVTKALESGTPLTNIRTKSAVNNYIQQNRLQQQKVSQYQSHPETHELLKRSNLNFHFTPPEGLKNSEFNEVDKVLYSFKKRMFITYVNSFISNYNQLSLERPLIKKSMKTERHTLTGKITFDTEGNIMKINILKSSFNDDIHKLFENTLIGVESLPNPPKIITEGKDQFVIYYQLQIN